MITNDGHYAPDPSHYMWAYIQDYFADKENAAPMWRTQTWWTTIYIPDNADELEWVLEFTKNYPDRVVKDIYTGQMYINGQEI